MNNPSNFRLRAPEAANYLRLSTSTLAKMRLRGDGPRYIKSGPRIVVYERQHLDDWLTSRVRNSTSE
jgi:predicted DNA-binding transcriptional regulator AlpA